MSSKQRVVALNDLPLTPVSGESESYSAILTEAQIADVFSDDSYPIIRVFAYGGAISLLFVTCMVII